MKRVIHCDICGKSQRVSSAPWECLHKDHDHGTGNMRGMLCRDCNLGLGSFKDSTISLKKAIKYLEKWQKHKTDGKNLSEEKC